MYSATLAVHSYLRWAVLVLALLAVARALAGWLGGRSWQVADERTSRLFTMVLDIQMLVGLLLYLGLSPLTRAALGNMGAAMGDSVLRFWGVEHLFGMLVAVVLTHVGRARARRQTDPVRRHRTSFIFFGIALLVMLVTIPWPGMPAGRPLLR